MEEFDGSFSAGCTRALAELDRYAPMEIAEGWNLGSSSGVRFWESATRERSNAQGDLYDRGHCHGAASLV
jgi:hypothetical protein